MALDHLTVITNPHKRVGRKRRALSSKARRNARKKPRSPAQKAATAKMLIARGWSSSAARKAAGVRKGTRLNASKRRRPAKKRKATKRKSSAKRSTARKRTSPRRNSTMARKRRQTPAQRRASLRNLRKARAARKGTRRNAPKRRRRKASARRRTTRRRSTRRTTARRRPARRRTNRRRTARRRQTPAQRRASLKNLRKARAARKRRNPRRRRRARRNAGIGTPSAGARTMRVVRSRRRTSKSKKRGLASLRRARRYLKGRRRSGSLAKAYASRHRMRTNRRRRRYRYNPRRRYVRRYRRNQATTAKLSVRGFTNMLPKFAAGLGGMLGTAFIGGYIGPYIPVGGAYNQLITSTVSVVATWFATDKVRFLKKYQLPILIGAGIGWAITALRTLAPGFAMQLGLAPAMAPANGMAGYWAEGIAPIGSRGLSDYVRSGVLEGEYVPSGTPTLGAYVEEPMSGLGAAYQMVAGLGIDVEEAIAGLGAMNRPWGSLQMAGLGLDAVPVAQSGCSNCNMGSVMPMSSVPRGLPVNVRMAALQKAGQVTRDIAVRPPREMLGVQSCGIYGSTIWE